MISIYPSLLFLVPFIAALLCATLGWWVRGAARWLALAGLGLTVLVAVLATERTLAAGSLHSYLGNWVPPIGIELLLDPLSAFVAALVAATAFVVMAGSGHSVRRQLAGRETSFYATALLLVCGLMGIIATGDLFNLFVHLEVASLAAYSLVAAGGRGAPRAALIYLLVGSLAASLYLLGVGFIYASTGSLNMADIATRLHEAPAPLAIGGIVLIVGGLAIKMALFPLHGWMPGAYALGPAASAALLAPLVTKVAAYALIRVLFWVYGATFVHETPMLMDVLAWAGAMAIVAGGLLALAQSDLWRLLAYSSISQMGIVVLGIGLANGAGLTGAVLHIANDALMKGALFLAAGVALLRFDVRRIDQLGALRGRAPWTVVAVAVAGISLIGLPPLAGFFGKWYVLQGAVESGQWALAAAVLLGTLATAAYVFRILEPLLFGAPAAAGAREGPSAMVLAALAFAAALVLLGLANERVVGTLLKVALPAGL